MNKLEHVFTKSVIDNLRNNKDEITPELLNELRCFGNAGKQVALDILDIQKDDEQYYVDAFNNRISFNGNRGLKKAFTKLPLSDIHKHEIAKCASDIHYFKDNYVKIKTKSGVSFPDLRPYQDDFIDFISHDDNEDNIGLMGRQSGKTISTAIYLAHQFNFNKNINIGIVANKGPMAREFLANTKNIFLELPIWLQQGISEWNKGSIANESKMRILTDVPSPDSFRGFTIAILVVDECVSYVETITIRDDCTNEVFDLCIGDFYYILDSKSISDHHDKESTSSYRLLQKYSVLSKNGFQKFSGVKKSKHNFSYTFKFNNNEITCTKHHLFNTHGDVFTEACKLRIGDYIGTEKIIDIIENNKEQEFFDLLDVKCGNHYITSGVTSHNCAFIKSTVWDEFSDSIFPSQSSLAWKKNIILSTANGMNHFYKMVQGAREDANGMNIFEVDWKDVPRFKADGTLMTPDEFMSKIVKKHGIVYFNQNYANEFLGSSYTLISGDKLREMKPSAVHEVRDGKLKIYNYPEAGHKYICTVDPAKDGSDSFVVNFTDITEFRFKQVAVAELQIDYLLMPEFINEWCEYYNNPFLIIENNEGAGQSIADQMYNDYEYTNLFFDIKVDTNTKNLTKGRKSYPGFRTTPKSRKQIIQTLKLFIENDNYEINDKKTIDQLFRFILINGKYKADNGAHDDLVMALALTFAPFANTKNFEDMRLLVDNMYNHESLDETEKYDFGELLASSSFNDGTDEEYAEQLRNESWDDNFDHFGGI